MTRDPLLRIGLYQNLVSAMDLHVAELEAQLTEFRCAVSEILAGGYGDPVELAKSARLSDLESDFKLKPVRERIANLKKSLASEPAADKSAYN